MIKKICDLCGKPATAPSTIDHTLDDQVLCDSGAKIRLMLHISFVGHSTGFGGPPDLCGGCLAKITEALNFLGQKFKG